VFFAFASPPIDMRWVNKEIYRVRGGYLVASDSTKRYAISRLLSKPRLRHKTTTSVAWSGNHDEFFRRAASRKPPTGPLRRAPSFIE
jgi:hypothetical protein